MGGSRGSRCGMQAAGAARRARAGVHAHACAREGAKAGWQVGNPCCSRPAPKAAHPSVLRLSASQLEGSGSKATTVALGHISLKNEAEKPALPPASARHAVLLQPVPPACNRRSTLAQAAALASAQPVEPSPACRATRPSWRRHRPAWPRLRAARGAHPHPARIAAPCPLETRRTTPSARGRHRSVVQLDGGREASGQGGGLAREGRVGLAAAQASGTSRCGGEQHLQPCVHVPRRGGGGGCAGSPNGQERTQQAPAPGGTPACRWTRSGTRSGGSSSQACRLPGGRARQ